MCGVLSAVWSYVPKRAAQYQLFYSFCSEIHKNSEIHLPTVAHQDHIIIVNCINQKCGTVSEMKRNDYHSVCACICVNFFFHSFLEMSDRCLPACCYPLTIRKSAYCGYYFFSFLFCISFTAVSCVLELRTNVRHYIISRSIIWIPWVAYLKRNETKSAKKRETARERGKLSKKERNKWTKEWMAIKYIHKITEFLPAHTQTNKRCFSFRVKHNENL